VDSAGEIFPSAAAVVHGGWICCPAGEGINIKEDEGKKAQRQGRKEQNRLI
jgi:hypothetical protein